MLMCVGFFVCLFVCLSRDVLNFDGFCLVIPQIIMFNAVSGFCRSKESSCDMALVVM